jgi:hypothetical protein
MKTFCSFTSSIAPVLLLTGQLLAGGQVAEVSTTTAQLSWPNSDWPRATPAEVGLDEAKLTQARDYALTGGGSGCIIRHGNLVLAWGDPKQLYDLKSTTKSFGATVLGLAVMDGTVQLDDPAIEFCPDLGVPPDTNAPTGWLDKITLRMLATQTAGFDPFTPEKLSLGFARITGGAADFKGVNLRSPTCESLGDGAKGRKASGLLCLDGVLYLLARNAGNAQLAWSADHGLTWTWADWTFTHSFGCPTFLNFGKDYAGARDEFVYLYSPDHDSAYEAADRMVLARVPAHQMRRREAYEFFVQLDAQGQPVWTKDIAQRGAVFTNPGRCYRSGVTYNAALKRFLWVQILPQSRHPQGPRFQGGVGVYDAPEPWGPWTTVFFTEDWDVGPGETASLPTKWMSADGRTVHLVFSGNDHLSVRQGTLVLQTEPNALSK